MESSPPGSGKDRKSQNANVVASVLLAVVPGLVFIFSEVFTDIKGPDQFQISLMILLGVPAALIGTSTYIIRGKHRGIKLIFPLSLILFNLLIFPTVWGISQVKLRMFVSANRTKLEYAANRLLDKKWNAENANRYLLQEKLLVSFEGKPGKDETVLFLIDSMLDNCMGIAFSRSGQVPTENDCGKLVEWKKIEDNWYKWTTI